MGIGKNVGTFLALLSMTAACYFEWKAVYTLQLIQGNLIFISGQLWYIVSRAGNHP